MNRLLPRVSPSVRTFVLLFAAVFALLLAAKWPYFFAYPVFEDGDAAVNALAIDRAKAFQEIHGNYSRYYFRHPGPAFFYVYALAERALCDAIPTGWSPNTVHSLAGLALQSAFFALALTLAAAWAPAPLFLALALLAAALHFAHVEGAFTSIWPPHVLLMPFLAFWVACISVASGRGEHLPWVFLSGSFLVHGHVVQPLFVGVVALCAYGVLADSRRRAGQRPAAPWAAFPRAHWIALGIFLVFALPIGLDLAQGARSNLHDILRQAENTTTQHKTLADSVLYFLSFLSYRTDQAARFAPGSTTRLSFLREHPWPYVLWLAGLGLTLGALASRRARAWGQTRRVLWLVLLFGAVAAALCLVWGVWQSGDMFGFNGHFYYGLTYGLMLGFCALLATLAPRAGARWLAGAIGLAAAVLTLRGFHSTASAGASAAGLELRDATRAALRADPRPEAPKLLVFPHDDWPKAAAAALALERSGRTFYVGRAWTFMFGRAHAVPRALLLDPHADLSVWRLVRSADPQLGVPFAGPLRLVFEPGPLSPEDGVIDCSRDGNLALYTMHGLVTPDADAAWTEQPDVTLQFRPLPAAHDVDLRLEGRPFLVGFKLPAQTVELWLNGVRLARARFARPGAGSMAARIPRDLWNREPTALLYLHFPDAASPAQFHKGDDPRLLGLLITRLTTGPAAP